MRKSYFVSVVLCVLLSFTQVYSATLKLVPQPAEIQLSKGNTSLSSKWTIVSSTNLPDDRYAIGLLQEEVKKDFRWEWKSSGKAVEKNVILLRNYTLKGNESDLFKEQGYTLEIKPAQIVISAPTPIGRYYGIQTLRQLLRTHPKAILPGLKIKDYPALQYRGVSDDISRGQVSSVKNFRDIIQELAYYKKNIYQPYIEDMFEFDVDPAIGEDRGHITKQEMAEMQEECSRNHMLLSPIFESLGHQDRLLSSGKNRKYAEIQDSTKAPWSFSPVDSNSFEFVTKLIDEMAAATPNPFFHIGGDESFDIGEGTSRDTVKAIGIGRVHAQYFNKLVDYIQQKHHREVMMYGDMLLRNPEALPEMNKNAIIVDWHYYPQSSYSTIRILHNAGFKKVIVSPGIWGWANFYPNMTLAYSNLSGFIQSAKEEGCIGSIASSWGDDAAENIRINNILPWAYSAAAEWEKQSPTGDDFIQRYIPVHYGVDDIDFAKALTILGDVKLTDVSYPARIFHQQPRIKLYGKEFIKQITAMHKDMLEAQRILNVYHNRLPYHQDHLAVLDDVVKRYIYMTDCVVSMDSIARMLNGTEMKNMPVMQQKIIQSKLENLRDQFQIIQGEYAILWLRYNKYPMLNNNLTRLQKQLSDLQELYLLSASNQLPAVPKPVGNWFWNPSQDTTLEHPERIVYFSKVIDIKKDISSAELKGWGDDNARFFMNGKEVMSVGFNNLPGIRNIAKHINKGQNIFAIQGNNTWGVGGIIFELKVKYTDKTEELFLADNTWLTSTTATDNWNKTPPTGNQWVPIKILGNGIIPPYEDFSW